MKPLRTNALIGIALAGVLAFGVACSDDDPDADLGPLETPSVPETVLPSPPASDAEQTKDEFVDKVNNQIEQMEERINEIEEDSQGLTGDAREEADQKIEDLKSEVDDLRTRLSDFEGANSDDLDAIKEDIEGKLNDAQTEIESLADRLGI
jgi:septal ring factor EnvC (AmiA/AmiB activator)